MTDPHSRISAADVRALAQRHGLEIQGDLEIHDIGLDFRIVKAHDTRLRPWALRIPRRQDLSGQIEREAKTLNWLAGQLPFSIPDWQIVSRELVAYPWMTGETAIEVCAATHNITWRVAPNSASYVATLGAALAALHGIPLPAAASAGFPQPGIDDVRKELHRDLDTVTQSFDVPPRWRERVQTWIDDSNLWPRACAFIHGDLYAGHVLVDAAENVTGFIDWSEAGVGDPGVDFVGHLQLFGEDGLRSLLDHYQRCGGHVWPEVIRHTTERMAAGPLRFAMFALRSADPGHRDAAAKQFAVL